MSSPTCPAPGAVPHQPAPVAPAATKSFAGEVAAEVRRLYANLVFLR